MNARKTLQVTLAFVGLLVGAGFATGQEVVQYFISFGTWGIAGAVVSGILMIAAGAVIIQIGSYFLAEEHRAVFHSVSHPVVSKFLDISVTLTLFAMGFVMLAGAGSTLEQQFGLPSWIGSAIMMGIVMLTGLLNVNKVTNIISAVTPLIFVAVIVAFIYTMLQLPVDLGAMSDLAVQADSPVSPWWLSAINYTCMALMLGVSMSLVIGGNTPDPRVAGWGGVLGGVVYTILLVMNAVALLVNYESVEGSDIPMLMLFETMHPMAALGMVFVTFVMIYNTCISMFYALGRRITVNHRKRYVPVFLGICVAGYLVSLIGFGTLMSYVYPAIGYVGTVMVVVMLVWWFRSRPDIASEESRRDRMRALLTMKESDDKDFPEGHEKRLQDAAEKSMADGEAITGAIDAEVIRSLSKKTGKHSGTHATQAPVSDPRDSR
ncbi:membrane protein [Kocuria gwangalliensis]|uniref:Membrane protein n=1 Tax=Kocuria gwangalliensis TaxID=501592 RepID=A0ABP8XGL3_9MICC